MDINELRPHIQSRIAHEFGNIFLDNLEFSIKNKLLEKEYKNEISLKNTAQKYLF